MCVTAKPATKHVVKSATLSAVIHRVGMRYRWDGVSLL